VAAAPNSIAVADWSQLPDSLKPLIHRSTNEAPTWRDPYPWLPDIRLWPDSVDFEGVRYRKRVLVLMAQGTQNATSIIASYDDTTAHPYATKGPSYSWHEDSTFAERSYEGQTWSYGRHGSLMGYARTLPDKSVLWEWFWPDGSLTILELLPQPRGLDPVTHRLFPAQQRYWKGQVMDDSDYSARTMEFNRTWRAVDDSLGAKGADQSKGKRR